MTKKVHVIAHTHWDFEWYFTRQHARVQFAYHMDEVLRALDENRVDYYLLDGQLSILDDYLTTVPEMRPTVKKFIKAKRLFVGPWFTQIDEMVTSGESIVRNLQQGIALGDNLGGAMRIGYLPDSFGQGKDMPKIYNGFDIINAVFWRGMPAEKSARYFYWTSEDESKVLVCNLRNGYPVGIELMASDDYSKLLDKISSDTDSDVTVLPVGGDQRPVDFNLKQRIDAANSEQKEYILKESTYPELFQDLKKQKRLPIYSGEFVDPSTSKIHRGIYSSRADLKQIYDELERRMTYIVEPLMAIANYQGLKPKEGLIGQIWRTIARGQAHDSSGGCNSDETNQDIKQRGIVALQMVDALEAYLLRKLGSNTPADVDVILWNARPVMSDAVRTVKLATKKSGFNILTLTGEEVHFDVISQKKVDVGEIRYNPADHVAEEYYETTVSFALKIPATDWVGLKIVSSENDLMPVSSTNSEIKNHYFKLEYLNEHLNLTDLRKGTVYQDFLSIEDGGDEGDTYDYSPSRQDWFNELDFANADVTAQQGKYLRTLTLRGYWKVPYDLNERSKRECSCKIAYTLNLKLTNQPIIDFNLEIDNTALDHRMRLLIHTDVTTTKSYSDTPFGTIMRDNIDTHLKDWQEIGYREEPTALRPMIHFANVHDNGHSWSFLGDGEKDFQVYGTHNVTLAITLFRGVGFLGRPDLLRRPGSASGLQLKYVPTPDSQLIGKRNFSGAIEMGYEYKPAQLQANYQALVCRNVYYQEQALDRFTSPIQYFPIDKNKCQLSHRQLVDIQAPAIVISAMTLTQDLKGLVVRVYNPRERELDKPGTIYLGQKANVMLLNLNDQPKSSLASSVSKINIASLKAGEIRTYGFYFTPTN